MKNGIRSRISTDCNLPTCTLNETGLRLIVYFWWWWFCFDGDGGDDGRVTRLVRGLARGWGRGTPNVLHSSSSSSSESRLRLRKLYLRLRLLCDGSLTNAFLTTYLASGSKIHGFCALSCHSSALGTGPQVQSSYPDHPSHTVVT